LSGGRQLLHGNSVFGQEVSTGSRWRRGKTAAFRCASRARRSKFARSPRRTEPRSSVA